MDKKKRIPNYRKIYNDIIDAKYAHLRIFCQPILSKENLSTLDVIRLNNIIFGIDDKKVEIFNQGHRSYDNETILKILSYQEINKLNNSELALHFKLSRNTVKKWRQIFISK
ncbi:helix-turn-helix domain-containing protein [Chryseobacterium sp.]|uniref:helix-turn-helix domain-containing protein n=1 Tax=Chryseobacterium sp. TaxID=1871047 RepID=UPI000EC04A3B|nr:helix-turn-helix domain-containing protein [Chryseobacterium sp.]HCA06132.1 transposase [Chryseobacterium sp.]